MTVVERYETNAKVSSGYRVFCKGASEIVLGRCTHFLDADGTPKPFDEAWAVRLRAVIEEMAQNGLRTICVGMTDYVRRSARATTTETAIDDGDHAVDWSDEASVASNFTGLCICGIQVSGAFVVRKTFASRRVCLQDPVRSEVPAAIARCRRAGVTIRMVTGARDERAFFNLTIACFLGDNVNTARAIALQWGILQPGKNFLVIEGRDFNERIRDEKGEVAQEKLDAIWP